MNVPLAIKKHYEDFYWPFLPASHRGNRYGGVRSRSEPSRWAKGGGGSTGVGTEIAVADSEVVA